MMTRPPCGRRDERKGPGRAVVAIAETHGRTGTAGLRNRKVRNDITVTSCRSLPNYRS
jgi:hypothetical protein